MVRPDLGPCWEWDGGTHGRGYGKLNDGRRTVSAHRLAYETWVGPIPANHQVCHRCDNPPCMNPTHLFTGPMAVNVADKVTKGRSGRGGSGWAARLTDAQVAEIRASVTGLRGEQAALAKCYGVSQATISLIVRGKHRTEVESGRLGGDRGASLRTAG